MKAQIDEAIMEVTQLIAGWRQRKQERHHLPQVAKFEIGKHKYPNLYDAATSRGNRMMKKARLEGYICSSLTVRPSHFILEFQKLHDTDDVIRL